MKINRRRYLYRMSETAAVAALYAALSLVCLPVGSFQFRPAEALAVLPVLTPAAVPGLTLGCLLANYITGCAVPDILIGSLATLLGALGTRLMRRRRFLPLFPPVLSNTLLIPPVLVYVYGATGAYVLLMLSVFIGEFVSCVLLGGFLLRALRRPGIGNRLFRE